MANVWHYHSACGNKYQLHEPIDAGALCPKCHRPFVPRNMYTCNGCGNVFYSDMNYKIGDRFACPINGEPVEVVSSSVIRPKAAEIPLRTGGTNWASVIKSLLIISILLVAGLIAISIVGQLASWLIKAIQTILSFAAAVLPIILAAIGEFVKLIAILIAGVGILVVIYWLFRATASRPADSFSEIFEATKKRDQLGHLRSELKLPPDAPDRLVIRETIAKSRDIVVKQQAVIYLLIIGAVVGELVCFFTSQTLEETRQVLKQFLGLGVVNIVGFGIIFYGGKFFFKLDKVLSSVTRAAKGFIFSVMFGTATVLTIVFVPPILGESSLSGSAVAIGLTLNIIADIFISLYDTLASLFWRTPKETMGIAFRRVWRRLTGVSGTSAAVPAVSKRRQAVESASSSPKSVKDKFVISLTHPKLLSKRFSSVFLVQIFPPELGSEASAKKTQQFPGEQPMEHVQDSQQLKVGQKVKIKLFSPEITFPEPVVKKLGNDVTVARFIAKPSDSCYPGSHQCILSIRDAESDIEYESMTFTVQVVDFAFDHVSRPFLSKATSAVLGVGSLTMFVLTLLGQIDTTFGVASGTVAAAIAGGIYLRFFTLFQQPKPASTP